MRSPSSPRWCVLCALLAVHVAAGLRLHLLPSHVTALRARHASAARMAAGDDRARKADESGGVSKADVADGAEEEGRRGIGIWQRMKRRTAKVVTTEEDPETIEAWVGTPLLEGVANDIDLAIERRRRRLNAKLGISLKNFRKEVVDEWEEQATEAKARQERLKERQRDMADSLAAFRQELVDEIEDGLTGVQRGGQKLESALKQMRETWELEVAELFRDAEDEVELAVRCLTRTHFCWSP